MKKVNPYYLFLENLLAELRITANGFQEKYGLRSFSAIFNKLKNDPEKLLHPETIGKIEEALKIRIDDSDIENITYTRVIEPEKDSGFSGAIGVTTYPVLSEVFAGEPDQIEIEYHGIKENFTYYESGHRCFALKVNGSSMETTLRDGDTVLVDMDLHPMDGDLVAVKLQNGHQYIKRYHKYNDFIIQLTSDNPEYGVRLIDTKDIAAIHPVVAINFNLRNGERERNNRVARN